MRCQCAADACASSAAAEAKPTCLSAWHDGSQWEKSSLQVSDLQQQEYTLQSCNVWGTYHAVEHGSYVHGLWQNSLTFQPGRHSLPSDAGSSLRPLSVQV